MASGFPGQVAGKDADTDLRFAYDAPLSIVLDVSPFMGGWSDFAGQIQSNAGPPDYASSSAVATWNARLPLRFEFNSTDDPASGAVYNITGIEVNYYRAGAFDAVWFYIYEIAQDGSASANLLDSYDSVAEFTTTAAWTKFTKALALPIDPKNKGYFLACQLTPNAAATGARLGTIRLTYTKTAVE